MADQDVRVPAGLTTDGLLGRRYLARSIDVIVITILFGVVLAFVNAMVPLKGNPLTGFFVIAALLLVVWIGYGTILESSVWQATVASAFWGCVCMTRTEAGCRCVKRQVATP